MVVRMFLRKGTIDPKKDKVGHGIRYESVYLIHCVLFKMKSNRAYKFLRNMQLLPLPGLSTIRRLLSSADCIFGFNKLALESIFEAFKGKATHERWGGVMLDEMANGKGLDFDTRTLTWKGIVDYGGELSIMVPNGLADHILVFVFRLYLASWIQPFAWFGTKGGASGTILVQLLVKAFSCLHKHGAIAKHTVLDVNQTNKSLMKQFGISGRENGTSFVEHLLEKGSKIHFMVDVSHLLKVVKNNMETHRCVQVFLIYDSLMSFNLKYCPSSFRDIWLTTSTTESCLILLN